MKQFLAVMAFLFAVSASPAQEKAVFPQQFIGHWQGTLNWYPQGATAPKTVNMELHIQPSKDTAGQYTWHIVYGKPSEDSRPYILKPVDTAKGHWIIDEVNGILLDQYWIGERFSGAFTVSGNTILNNYWIENGQLQVEFYSYPAKPLAVTGQGTEDSPKVDSYNIRSFQRATLSKK